MMSQCCISRDSFLRFLIFQPIMTFSNGYQTKAFATCNLLLCTCGKALMHNLLQIIVMVDKSPNPTLAFWDHCLLQSVQKVFRPL
ncbi:hypothetical protein GDO81_009478 [Engystomops pustulosus]|uniref:Uncharacterized protein n=1 Tax=Engystomops pustulosus TaxID=76066 RepID=A0AAV7BS15_ENGPU|nr:hypothetical protein GDO81_009478 [Engystomops pustulosus]